MSHLAYPFVGWRPKSFYRLTYAIDAPFELQASWFTHLREGRGWLWNLIAIQLVVADCGICAIFTATASLVLWSQKTLLPTWISSTPSPCLKGKCDRHPDASRKYLEVQDASRWYCAFSILLKSLAHIFQCLADHGLGSPGRRFQKQLLHLCVVLRPDKIKWRDASAQSKPLPWRSVFKREGLV